MLAAHANQVSIFRIDSKDRQPVGTLPRRYQKRIVGRQAELPRGLFCFEDSHPLEFSMGQSLEKSNAVMPPVGGVKEPAVVGDFQVSAGVSVLECLGQGGKGLGRFQGSLPGIHLEHGHTRALFIDGKKSGC